MGRSAKEFCRPDQPVDGGGMVNFGGWDINDRDPREPRNPNEKRMDPFTRSSRELMPPEPRAFYGKESGRWFNNSRRNMSDEAAGVQRKVSDDAAGRINRRSRPGGPSGMPVGNTK